MIATKKANSAVFACIGGTSTSIAMTLAATALTGGTVTASVVTAALATHVLGRLIATPAVSGVAVLGCGLKKGEDPQPDSLQAGLEDYAAWICETLGGSDAQKTSSSAESHRQEVPEVAPGDDMV